MKVGDLVRIVTAKRSVRRDSVRMMETYQLPEEKQRLGIVIEVVDHNRVMVYWPAGNFKVMEMQHLEACNESR